MRTTDWNGLPVQHVNWNGRLIDVNEMYFNGDIV